ncbi:ABC transporter substrate-binding protein [Salinisphaera sp. USBA-960]|uniref:ABC transporter substrate-binding protein n=1 Tax=Salinisphaera orenii TaxID=856731 RepID=UPI000DBEA334|nr:ABC transporter substrate-binding protein [Salifodinibacter halophilus]NNC26614.1 ABC transporter substrate-binding protein [Salifodinibacter halophilus]
MSDCCNNSTVGQGTEDALFISRGVSRRALLKRMGSVAGAAALAGLPACSSGGGETVKLAFCSQLLCVAPYEATRAAGFFAEEGLDVQLVYSRGGSAAVQALNAGGVDYAATSFDAALNAFANGANVMRFATTGRLPLFALATGPHTADGIRSIDDLKGKTVGVAQLGNSDHALMLYLLEQNGIDSDSVNFAILGPNLYDALRLGQVDAGMVQEPGLTLLQREGARVLVNLMTTEDAKRYLGGAYEFMGVAVRPDEAEQRREQMQKIGRALTAGMEYMQQAPIEDIIDALPDELVAGGDMEVLAKALAEYRASLYPSSVQISRDACDSVMKAHLLADIQKEPVNMDQLLNQSVLGA